MSKIVMEKKFDQSKYIDDYNKKNYKTVKLRLKFNKKKELDDIMKKNNIKSYREMILKFIEIMRIK